MLLPILLAGGVLLLVLAIAFASPMYKKTALPAQAEVVVEQPGSLRVTFMAWERLRLIYNALLLVVVLCALLFGKAYLSSATGISPVHFAFDSTFLITAPLSAIGANILFFAGPLSEIYLRLLGINTQTLARVRWATFVLGCLLGGILAFFGTKALAFQIAYAYA